MSDPILITDPTDLLNHPEIYPFSLDGEKKVVTFVHVSRARMHKAAFHDQSLVTSSAQKWAVSVNDLMAWAALFREKLLESPRFIFHTSYCGSTLLARALDVPGRCVVYREPHIIYELRMLRRRIDGGDPAFLADWQRLFVSVMALLGRSFSEDEQVVVKLAAEDSYVMDDLLALGESAKGVFLYNDLPGHLTAVLKSKPRRQKFHELAEMYAGFSTMRGTLPSVEVEALNDAQVAAYVWLWHVENVRQAKGNVASLSSAAFFEQKVDAITAVSDYFALPFSQADIAEIDTSAILQTDAKAVRGGIVGRGFRKLGLYRQVERWLPEETVFSEADRKKQIQHHMAALQPEIESGIQWAEEFLGRPVTIPQPLLP